MYILDTNTLIYFFKGIGNISKHLLAQEPTNIGIPSVVLFEIESGIAKSISPEKRLRQMQSLTSVVHILPLGKEEASCAALIRAKLEAQGQPIGPYDLLIAGTAMANKGILITHNIKEFCRIDTLQVEDWY
ncbi:MAG: type II toxin-antitoxin system VapC family toxin [Desulfobacterales bacterium]|nr:type II toxin-antitoxin system VapC family toxin [Desulfobacterales bacterium]